MPSDRLVGLRFRWKEVLEVCTGPMVNGLTLAFAVTDGAVRLTAASTCTGTLSRLASKITETPGLRASPAAVVPPAGASRNCAVFTTNELTTAAEAFGSMASGVSAGPPYGL